MKYESNQVLGIPRYYLYGESTREVGHQFIHIETIGSRSRTHGWSIQPHVHNELHQILFLEQGAARYLNDINEFNIVAPTIVNVPSQYVHGFKFESESEGWVVTLSSELLWRISQNHSEFKPLIHQSVVLALDAAKAESFREKFATLAREFADEQAGCRAAAESAFLAILVNAIRVKFGTDHPVPNHHDADAELISRYRNLIEKNFRSNLGATEYAMRLCVCHERLRIASIRITGTSPLVLINGRRLLEAKRYLLYTNMSIAEVAYQSGFQDPAYFSRFFARSAGKTPREFRMTPAK